MIGSAILREAFKTTKGRAQLVE
jgi:hypothetical protein